MISYHPNYEPVNKPYICKLFKASNGEEVHTAINISNEAEKAELTVETVYEHLENVLKYMQDRSKSLSVIQYDEEVNGEPWPVRGWPDMEWAINEVWLWWNYIYYKERHAHSHIYTTSDGTEIVLDGLSQEEAEQAILAAEAHTHSGSEDHTHDPETGEEIPNA